MKLLTGSRSRGVFACAALTVTVAFMLALASQASAAYPAPTFSLTAAPTQAAGHPKLTVSIDPDAAYIDNNGGDDLKDITIDAPAGLQLNQSAATTKCSETTFTGSTCPTASQVGTASIKWRRSSISSVTLTGNVFVLATPAAANTAVLGLVLKATGYKTQRVRAVVSNALPVSSPTRVAVTGLARSIDSNVVLNLGATIDQITVVLNAKANASQSGPYFTLSPSSCSTAVTRAVFTSHQNVVVEKTSSYAPTSCDKVLFQPTATVKPTVASFNTPTGLDASFTVPAGELTTQHSAVSNITIATPSGVLLNNPDISALIPCADANLLADTCTSASKIGTTTFTFWGAAAAPGDVYLTARGAGGFDLAAVSRGANGVVAITRGTVREIDTNGDLVADSLGINLDRLPGATWSAAALKITSTLLRNNCPTGNATTTFQGASASTVVRTGTWLLGSCPPAPDTTITSGPTGLIANNRPTFTFVSSGNSGATFECNMDGGAFTACASPYVAGPLTDAPHNFCVRATVSGMTDQSPACASFTVDTIAPTVTILTFGPQVSFVTEAGATVTCTLNSSPAVTCTSPWTITPPLGGYSVTICATDAAGNTGCATMVVDPPPLTVTITTAPPSTTISSSATFGFVASTTPATFECSFDGGPFSACTSPKTYTAYPMGSHTFCVRGRDAVGNPSINTDCRTFIYDNPPPPMQLIRTAPASSPSNSTSATFTVTNVPAGATLMGSLDGAAGTPFTVPKVFTGLSDGAHTFTAYAVDGSGVSSPALSNTWVVDTIAPPAPTLVRVSPTTSPSSSTSAQFTFTDTESPVTFQTSLDGAAYAVATSPVTLTALTSGTHTFSVRAVDTAGNISASVSDNWMSGGPPPPPPAVSGPSGLVASTSATLAFSSSTTGVTFECQLNSSAWAACTSPRLLTGLAQGSQMFCVRVRDAEGNIGGSTCISWVVDTVAPPAPTLTRVSPTSSPTPSTAAQFVFSDSESGVSFRASIDGGAFAPATSPVNLSNLSSGTHTFAVRAVDLAGNQSTSASNSWTVEGEPVIPIIASGPANPTSFNAAVFTFSGAPVGATYQCQLDGAAWSTCVSPMNYAGLSDGAHQFCVRIVDSGGNISSSACRTWVVDTTPPAAPTVTLVSPTASPTNQTTATISWLGAEPGGSFQRSIDGGAYGASLSPLNLSNLADGCHTVSVRQVDLAGNIGGAGAVGWCVGGVPPLPAPTLTRTSPTNSPASQSSATFVVSDQAAGTTLQASLDGAPFAATTSPINLTGLADGTHSFRVRLIDAAATTSPEVSDSWSIDTIAPAAPPLAVTSPVSSPTTQTTATIAIGKTESGVTLEGSLDGGAFASVGSYAYLSGLSIGSHTYSARQVDPAGNLSSVSTVVWTIIAPTTDTAPPSINNLSSSMGAGGATISYSATDDSGAAPTCTPASGTTFPFHSTATLIVEVSCLDGSGNMNWTSLNVTSNGPAAGLVTTLSGGPSGNTTNPTPTFSYTINRSASGTLPCSLGQTCAAVTVPLVEFKCTVDGSAVPCSAGSFTPPPLVLGLHTFCVASRGIYSGEASAPACRTFNVVTTGSTPPDVTVTSPPFYGGTGASPINVAYTVNGSTTIPAGTTCSVNGVASTSATTNAAALELGTNAIPVRCANASGSETEYVVMTRYSGFAVAITTPAPGLTTSSPSVNVTYNTRSYGASGTCAINGGASTSGSTNNVALPLGASSIDLVCPWGNSVTKSSINVTRGAAPAVAITAPASGDTAASPVNVSYTVDGSSSIPADTTCLLNGVSSTSATTNAFVLASGPNLVTVSCSNSFGYNTATITVTNSAPGSAVEITSGPTGTVGSTTATFTFVGFQAGDTFQCRLDTGGWTGCVSPVTFTGLSQGSHTLSVRAVDSAGNVSPTASRTWFVDTTPPPAPVVSGPTGVVASTSAVYTLTVSSPAGGETFECSFDSIVYAACTSPVAYTGLVDGPHTFCARVVNAVGVRSTSSCRSHVVDTIPPPAPNVSGPSGVIPQTDVTITFTDTESPVTFEASRDGGAFAPVTSPVVLNGLSVGAHTYAVRAVDTVGNVGSATTIAWTNAVVDYVVTITDGPSGAFSSNQASFEFTGAAPGFGYECSLDSSSWSACTSPANYTGLTEGSHTFCVRAPNSMGSPCRTWTVDTIAPVVTLNSPYPSQQLAAYTSVSFSASDASAIASTTCALDAPPASACSSPWQPYLVTDAPHQLEICATDAAGNSGCLPYSWTPAPPTATITSGPSGTTTSTSASFTFTANFPNPTFHCALDSGAFASCASPVNLTALSAGTHTFRVRAVTAGGTIGPSTSRSWTVPSGNIVTITSGPAEGSVITTLTATFTYAAAQQTTGTPCPVGQTCVQVIVDITPYYCSFDGSGYQYCGGSSLTSSRYTTPSLINGAHTFCVRASGVAGIDPQTHAAIPDGVLGPTTCRSFTRIS